MVSSSSSSDSDCESDKVPRMFWGELIYATPGSGKTYICNKYEGVVDTDDLMVEAIEELWPRWINYAKRKSNYDSRQAIMNFLRYIHFRQRERAKLYDRTLLKMQICARQDKVVLFGSKDLIEHANRIFVQKNSAIIRGRFSSKKENTIIDRKYSGKLHYIYNYLDDSMQMAAAGMLEVLYA
jgi:hypothetical protein